MTRSRRIGVLLVGLALGLGWACNEPVEDDGGAERQRMARNQCSADSDCQLTGCRGTVCRAEPDPSFCEHRLVLSVLDGAPAELEAAVRDIVGAALAPRQRETLTVSADSNSILVSFHAPLAQRARVETTLAELESGGFYVAHPQAEAISSRVAAARVAQGMRTRRAEGGPLLLEAPIRAGDVLSFDDVRVAAESLRAALASELPSDAQLGLEPLVDVQPPVVRAWILGTDEVVAFPELLALTNIAGDAQNPTFEGHLSRVGAQALATLTESRVGQPLIVLVGEDVLAAAKIVAPISDGKFLIRLNAGTADDQSFAERIRRLRNTPALARQLRFDRPATLHAERDLSCLTAQPPLAACRCIEGYCQREQTPAFDACMEAP